MSHTEAEAEIRATAAAWDRAMIGNDAGEIGRFMAPEWVITGSDGKSSGKAEFLEQIRDGRLTHHTMTTEDASVRIYESVGVVTARGVSAGHYEGRPFHEIERQSNVFVKRQGAWRCVLTHLSRIS